MDSKTKQPIDRQQALAAAKRIIDGGDDTFGGMTSYDESRQKEEDVELLARFVVQEFGGDNRG